MLAEWLSLWYSRNILKKRYEVKIPDNVVPRPNNIEVEVVRILAEYFCQDVTFIKRTDLHKTPDIIIGELQWKIKSPRGSGKRNIQHQFYRALKQSKNIIIDARYSKLHDAKLEREVKSQFMMSKTVERLILITKQKGVIDYNKDT